MTEDYKTPKFCTRCVVSDQRPRITFDENGVCNACKYWERKDNYINWDKREEELNNLLNKHRREDGRFDVIVPSSGGKDSAFVAHILKYNYGMNPLTVTWAPHLYTEVGWKNFQSLIDSGLSNILGTPDRKIHRKMTKICTEEMGDPFQPFIYGQVWFPVHAALSYDVPLIFDGENGEAEYGGDSASENLNGFNVEETTQYWFSGHPVEYWLNHGFTKKDLYMYMPPEQEKIQELNLERHFFSYYKNWRPQNNYYYATENTGFIANPEGRSEGTFSKYASLDDKIDPFHFYFGLLKFGLGRATSDAAHEIREGLIERDEAIALVRKFDQEFPIKSFKTFLDYCEITEDEFRVIEDKWRNKNLWYRDGNNWLLKYQVS